MMVALLLGSIAATEIEVYFLGLTPLLIIAVVAAGFAFRGRLQRASLGCPVSPRALLVPFLGRCNHHERLALMNRRA